MIGMMEVMDPAPIAPVLPAADFVLQPARSSALERAFSRPSPTRASGRAGVGLWHAVPGALSAAVAAVSRTRGRLRAQRQVLKAVSLDEGVEVAAAKVDALKSLISKVLEVKSMPQQLEPFLRVLQASGYDILDKDEWRKIGGDLHPFLLPVATKGSFDDDLEVLALLIRAPNGKQLRPDEWQVVTQQPRKTKVVKLMADDISRYIVKRAEEATFRKEKQDMPIIEATKDVYEVRFQGQDQFALDKWLLLEVGAFPDVYKNLAMEHITSGDAMTGLVIADTMAKGQALMDAVVCGHKSYNGIRDELYNIYEEVPGCDPLCNLIEYFKQK